MIKYSKIKLGIILLSFLILPKISYGITTATSTATSTATLGDIAFGQAIIITLLSLGLTGFAFNSISSKKPWKI